MELTKMQGMDAASIRSLREKLGLTATQFAVRVGVSENCVRRWELATDSHRHPSGPAVLAILALAEEANGSNGHAHGKGGKKLVGAK